MTNIRDFPGSTARRNLHNVTGWLSDLANLSAATTPLADAKVKIASMAAALVEEYPPAAFTRQSLLAVARQCKFFPSYGELCAALTPWWNENRPVLPALPAPYQHVPTPLRERATTQELESVRDIVARGVADINAAYDAVYAPKPAAAEGHVTRQLTRDTLAEAYRAASVKGPKVPA
jgi:hypothetical protein